MKIQVVGAGLAGATAAALLRRAGHKVEIFEEREHIGGNCYDKWVDGILVHQYGPHGFHTNKEEVWNFVNHFSSFHSTALTVVGNTDLGVIPVPFNDVSAKLVGNLSGEEIRDLIFRAYSEKHWGVLWEQVPSSITSRVPQRRQSEDCRYHLDRWQGVPRGGYTAMFEAMLDGIDCHLGCEPEDWRKSAADHVIYTGSIDEFFKCSHGLLGYRSLDFQYQREPRREYFQINECNHRNPWTRSIDHSHWLDQEVADSVISYEFPSEWERGRVRMYPKPFGDNPEKYLAYAKLAKDGKGVTFLGRLATYKYLDMDDVIAQVMLRISQLLGQPCPFRLNDSSNVS